MIKPIKGENINQEAKVKEKDKISWVIMRASPSSPFLSICRADEPVIGEVAARGSGLNLV